MRMLNFSFWVQAVKIPSCKNFNAKELGDGRLFKMRLFSRGYGTGLPENILLHIIIITLSLKQE